MNRLIVIAAAALAAVGVAGLAHAGSSTAQKLDLVGVPSTQRVTLDIGPKGDSPGDMGVKAGTLYENGKRAGHYQGFCVWMPSQSSICTFTLSLAGGQILIQSGYGAGLNDGPTVHEPVIGGSGVYSGARGEGVDHEQGRKDVFHISLTS
jgi:hypothetical protein